MTVPEFAPAAAYSLELPRNPRPIVILGAGGIVHDAHLPAYRKAGYPVFGIENRELHADRVEHHLRRRLLIPQVAAEDRAVHRAGGAEPAPRHDRANI